MALHDNNEVHKNVNNIPRKLYVAIKNVNGTMVLLDKIEFTKLSTTEKIWFKVNNLNPQVKIWKDTQQALFDTLRPIDFTPADLVAFAGSATYTGIDGLGTVVFPDRVGVDITIPKNGFLTNGDKVHITLIPKTGYKISGPREFDIDIPADSFSTPTHTVLMTTQKWADITKDITYTGKEGEGLALGKGTPDYDITIMPADHLASGDTIQITANPTGQAVLTGPTQLMITIPPNSFNDIHDSTWAEVVSRFEPILHYSGYDGTGSIPQLDLIDSGAAIFSPISGLSNGGTVVASITLKDGYTIDGHSNAEGIYTNTFIIPPNRLPFDPKTVIGDNVPHDSIIPNLHFTGYQAHGEVSDGVYKEFSHTFTPATGLSNGDVITVDITVNPGYHYDGPASFTYTIPDGTFPDKPAKPVAATDTIYPITARGGGITNSDGGVSAKANSNWISGGTNTIPDDVQTSDPLDPKHLVVYDGVKSIYANAFAFPQFTSIDLPDGLLTIGNGAVGFSKITSLVIPDSVTEIGGSAFGASPLTSLVIPNSAITIGGSAFANIVNAATTHVTMPSKFNNKPFKDYIFGSRTFKSHWDQITFTWT